MRSLLPFIQMMTQALLLSAKTQATPSPYGAMKSGRMMLDKLNDQMGTGITYMAHLQELMCILNLMLGNFSSAKAAPILIIILVCGVPLRS